MLATCPSPSHVFVFALSPCPRSAAVPTHVGQCLLLHFRSGLLYAIDQKLYLVWEFIILSQGSLPSTLPLYQRMPFRNRHSMRRDLHPLRFFSSLCLWRLDYIVFRYCRGISCKASCFSRTKIDKTIFGVRCWNSDCKMLGMNHQDLGEHETPVEDIDRSKGINVEIGSY